MLAPGR